MYSLIGLEGNIENLLVLTSNMGKCSFTAFDLKQNYKKYLLTIHPASATKSPSVGEVELVWSSGLAWPLETRQMVIQCLGLIEHLDEGFAGLFNLVIEKIFSCRAPMDSASRSDGGLGCIFLDPKPGWQIQDYLENFVGKLTYSLLILDEKRCAYFNRKVNLEETDFWMYAPFMGKINSIDKIVQSLFVAHEILSFRVRHFGFYSEVNAQASSEELLQGAYATVDLLKSCQPDLTSLHLKGLLNKILKSLDKISRIRDESHFSHQGSVS